MPALYQRHRHEFNVAAWDGDPRKLTTTERDTVDAVIKYYGDKTSDWFSELTHMERPWVDAQKGIPPGERGNTEITHAAMVEYYSSLK